jgi:tetratricopeptide (TPR) repeat protein
MITSLTSNRASFVSVFGSFCANHQFSNLTQAQEAYTISKNLDSTSQTPLTSLAMISQLRGDTRQAIRLYHQALSLNPQDPMTTVLLEMTLKEQVERLGPESIESLPEGLRGREIDPFGVVKVGYLLASTLYLPGFFRNKHLIWGEWLYNIDSLDYHFEMGDSSLPLN